MWQLVLCHWTLMRLQVKGRDRSPNQSGPPHAWPWPFRPRHAGHQHAMVTSGHSLQLSQYISWSGPPKVCLLKAMVLPVVMYGCKSRTIKKAERQRIGALELWCWRRLLRVPWAARRSNQSILKEISPGYLLKGLMLKLKLQYFGHLMRRADSLEKALMLGKIEGRRRRGMTEDEMVGWHHQLYRHEFVWTLRVSDGQRGLGCCSS